MRYLLFIFVLFFSFQQKALSQNSINIFLVAKPHMPDIRFKETVIVMLHHNNKGAAGLVVNKPIETMSINKLFAGSNLSPPKNMVKKEITLYWGGPVDPENIFFIHTSDYKSKDFIFSNQYFIITRSPDILFDIAKNQGPKKYLILSGISAWSPGQLDSEMKRGDWDKKSNSYISVFNNGDEMWHHLINSQDI